jgi:hypothetical protein
MSSRPAVLAGSARLAAAASRPRRSRAWTRPLGALALLGVGLDHLQEYAGAHYSAIPTIGPLFLANFAAATVVALVFAVRGGRLPAIAGIAVSAGSLAALAVSEHGGLFGFTEVGYRPAIVLAIGFEVAATVLLGLHVVLRR